MPPPQNTSSSQKSLSSTIPLVVGRYLEGIGEPPPLIQGILRRCHRCDTDSCIFVPDSTGDWWCRCTSCSRCWNLFMDLRRRNGLSSAEAMDWLVQNSVMGRDDAQLYAHVSVKKQVALDWFDQHRLESVRSGDARRVIPGEWARCQMHHAIEFLRENGLHDLTMECRRHPHGWTSMHRTINGIPCQISITRADVKQSPEISLSFCRGSQRGFFVDGVIGSGGTVYVITSERLRDLEEIPPERPLFVVTSAGRWSSSFSPPPVWQDIVLLSGARTLNADLIKNVSLLGSGALARVDNVIMDIDEAMAEGNRWPSIIGFAWKSGAISDDTTTRIIEMVASRKGSSVKSVLGAIRRNSGMIAEKFSPDGMAITPDGMATRGSLSTLDGRRVRQKRVPARLCNFQLFRLPSAGQDVAFSLVVGDKRIELSVSAEIASDSNLLMVELRAAAKEHNMGELTVYRRSPYPKDLLTNERK